MRTYLAGIVLVVAGLGGCSSDGNTSTTEATPDSAAADVCGSVDALRFSLTDLRAERVVQEGTDSLAQAWSTVQEDWAQLADDARATHADEVDAVQAEADAVQTAVTEATEAPSAATLGTVATAVTAFRQDAGAFMDDVGLTC